MKQFLLYVASLIIATVVLATTSMFVPPVWAMCMCTYNEIKGFLVFPGSFIAGSIVVLLTYFSVMKGRSYRNAFFVNLLYFILIFSIFGFLIDPVSKYIDENKISIFQPDFPKEPNFIVPFSRTE